MSDGGGYASRFGQPVRARLPARRSGNTYKATIKGHKIYLRTGEYDDGTLGEIFVDMHKEGAAFRGMMNCFAICVSLCLQHGVPLSLLVKRFTGVQFEPDGPVQGQPQVPEARSVIDFVFQMLAAEYPEQAGVSANERQAAE